MTHNINRIKNKRISVTLTPELDNNLEKWRSKYGQSKNDIVIMALLRLFAESRIPNQKQMTN